MLRLALPLVLASLLVAACESDKTALIVEVTSEDFAAPGDIDALRFEARSEFEAMVDQTFPLTSNWPHSLAIVPPEAERRGRVTVSVTGTYQGNFVVRHVASTTFGSGIARKLAIHLEGLCRGVMCTAGVDCRAGRCDDAELDGGVGDADVQSDGGVDLDAGTGDGGKLTTDGGDGGMRDGGALTTDGGDGGSDTGVHDAGPPPRSVLLLTEVNYDDPGEDTSEFVEVINTTDVALPLEGVSLFFINGSSSPASTYGEQPLSGALLPGQRLVIGPASFIASFPPAVRGQATSITIQNGHPDAVALYDTLAGELIDALSYGGAILDADIDGHRVSLVEGTATAARDSSTVVRSVCRLPDSIDTGNDAVDWAMCSVPSPGAPNQL